MSYIDIEPTSKGGHVQMYVYKSNYHMNYELYFLLISVNILQPRRALVIFINTPPYVDGFKITHCQKTRENICYRLVDNPMSRYRDIQASFNGILSNNYVFYVTNYYVLTHFVCDVT